MLPTPPFFPQTDAWARALFTEGIRHLGDAHVLHRGDRPAAAITSAMKAAELGVKAVLVLDGALGWWEKLHTTHTPLTDMSGHQILRRHVELLEGRNSTLRAGVRELETLAPNRPGAGSFQVAQEANPEYPFFAAIPDAASGVLSPQLHSPASYFDTADSARYYAIALQLLIELQLNYPVIAGWDSALPPAL